MREIRLIDGNALQRKISALCEKNKELIDNWFANIIDDEIEDFPTIDPVKHGKWIKRAKTNPYVELCSDYDWECSECGKMDTHNEKVEVRYCWNCGARMEGEEE